MLAYRRKPRGGRVQTQGGGGGVLIIAPHSSILALWCKKGKDAGGVKGYPNPKDAGGVKD